MRSIFMDKPSLAPVIILLISIGALGGAYFFQYVLGYQPCQLCYWQRYPYMFVIVLMLAVLLLRQGAGSLPTILFALGILALFTDAGIAAFHTGVEYKWWPGLDSCSAPTDGPLTLDAIQDGTAGTIVPCDEAAWRLFGISMAGYNFIIALGTALYGLSQIKKVNV